MHMCMSSSIERHFMHLLRCLFVLGCSVLFVCLVGLFHLNIYNLYMFSYVFIPLISAVSFGRVDFARSGCLRFASESTTCAGGVFICTLRVHKGGFSKWRPPQTCVFHWFPLTYLFGKWLHHFTGHMA